MTHNTAVLKEGAWSKVAQELFELQTQVRQLTKQQEALRSQLKILSGDQSARDEQFLFRKVVQNRDKIDLQFLAMMEEIDLDQYKETTEVQVWNLLKL